MNRIFFFIFTTVLINIYGQDSIQNLNSEMARLKLETVLIVQSQAIDDSPLWSPNSDYVACNIEGNWYKFRLSNIEISEAKWHGQTIGVVTTKDSHSKLTKKEQKSYRKVSEYNPREVTTKDGTLVELKMKGMTTSLIVTKKGEEPKVLWTSGGENCHSLVLSPDGKYVAYLCELNGLLIMKLN